MFNFCFCSKPKRSRFDTSIETQVTDDQQVMLELIYSDLASRNSANMITMENFLIFFNLTGLWGAKLFRQFDDNKNKLVSKEEFFYGLSRTAKAPFEEKITQLFNFFKDKEDNGIKYKDFTKMLYNYSRDELKEILMEDKYMVSELNPALQKSLDLNDSCQTVMSSGLLYRSSDSQLYLKKKETVIQLDYQQPKLENRTSFQKNYAEFNQYKDPGTCVEIRMNQLTFKVNYCNMITLVKDFAKKIYKKYHIDIKNGRFTYEQFSQWIQAHNKLFKTYYTNFHIDIWSYHDNQPNFLTKIQKTFQGKLTTNNKTENVYAMLVGDILVIASSFKERKTPFKIICLEGLDMYEVDNSIGFGIQIKHRDDLYVKSIIYFQNRAQQQEYLEIFKIYQGNSLHDIYNAHEVIGTGKFSIVYRCTQKQTGKSYALKDISCQKLTPVFQDLINNESEIMKVISHPQIVKYQETIMSKTHIYIIAEYIYGKDLYEYVKKKKYLSEYVAAFIIGKIIEAVMYLHSLEIVHRDLKPENIMVTMKKNSINLDKSSNYSNEDSIENIKIIDFGLSYHLSELEKAPNGGGLAGTPNYIAPEIIMGEKPTYKIDNFAIGSILYFLLSGKFAFAYKDMETTLLRTAKGEFNFNGSIWKNVSLQAKDLIHKLLEVEPQQRIELEEALNHPWFDVVTKRPSPCTSETDKSDSEFEARGEIKISTLEDINVNELKDEELKIKIKKRKL